MWLWLWSIRCCDSWRVSRRRVWSNGWQSGRRRVAKSTDPETVPSRGAGCTVLVEEVCAVTSVETSFRPRRRGTASWHVRHRGAARERCNGFVAQLLCGEDVLVKPSPTNVGFGCLFDKRCRLFSWRVGGWRLGCCINDERRFGCARPDRCPILAAAEGQLLVGWHAPRGKVRRLV